MLSTSEIAALKRERATYLANGQTDRAAQVEAVLGGAAEKAAYAPVVEAPEAAPTENAAAPRARKRR